MTTLCCVAKFIRTLSTVISTIDLKLPLYTAGVHRVSDISIIHLFVVICHYATTSPHLNPQVHSAHPPRLVPDSASASPGILFYCAWFRKSQLPLLYTYPRAMRK